MFHIFNNLAFPENREDTKVSSFPLTYLQFFLSKIAEILKLYCNSATNNIDKALMSVY